MTIENVGCPRIGLMTSRSSAMPNKAMPAMALMTASQNGNPSRVMQARPAKAPSIINSPCAKLTVSVAL